MSNKKNSYRDSFKKIMARATVQSISNPNKTGLFISQANNKYFAYRKVYLTAKSKWGVDYADILLERLINNEIKTPNSSQFIDENHVSHRGFVHSNFNVNYFLSSQLNNRFIDLHVFISNIISEVITRYKTKQHDILEIRYLFETLSCFMEHYFSENKLDKVFQHSGEANHSVNTNYDYFVSNSREKRRCIRGSGRLFKILVDTLIRSFCSGINESPNAVIILDDYFIQRAKEDIVPLRDVVLPAEGVAVSGSHRYRPNYTLQLDLLEYVLKTYYVLREHLEVRPPILQVNMLIEPLRKEKVVNFLKTAFKLPVSTIREHIKNIDFEKDSADLDELEKIGMTLSNLSRKGKITLETKSCTNVAKVMYMLMQRVVGYSVVDKELYRFIKANPNSRYLPVSIMTEQQVNDYVTPPFSEVDIDVSKIAYKVYEEQQGGVGDFVKELRKVYSDAQSINITRRYIFPHLDTNKEQRLNVNLYKIEADVYSQIYSIINSANEELKNIYKDNFTFTIKLTDLYYSSNG